MAGNELRIFTGCWVMYACSGEVCGAPNCSFAENYETNINTRAYPSFEVPCKVNMQVLLQQKKQENHQRSLHRKHFFAKCFAYTFQAKDQQSPE